MSYDIAKLKEIRDLDCDFAMMNYQNQSEYFKKLDAFINDAKLYLCGYTAAVVIYSESDRTKFLTEIKQIQTTLRLLGMSTAAAKMHNIVDAVNEKSAEILSYALLVFSSEMEIKANAIKSAQSLLA